jgi:DNA invertase Pin-like site-specific DNA recombinase
MNNNNAIIYSRLSSPAQCSINNFHISIENQLTNCRIYCNNNKMNIVEEVHEIKSARNMKYLYKLNKIVENYSNINLIIYNITRFSRNILQGLQYIEKLNQKNITVHFIEENAKSNHHLDLHRIRLGLSQSEYESDTISNRVKSNNIVLKNKGWSFGNPKYGKETTYKNGIRCFQSNNSENKIIQFIIVARKGKCTVMALNKLLQEIIPNNTDLIEFYDNETFSLITRFDHPYTLSFRVISDLLNSYNIMNRNKIWSASSVNRIYNDNCTNIQKKFLSMNI